MTAPSAIELLAEVRRVGGWLTPKPPDTLGVDLPPSEMPRLAPLLAQRKHDLLMLLRPLDLPCIACGGMYRWQDRAGAWHCGQCEPDPSARHLRGVSLETLGNRAITLAAPTGDLPAVKEWVRVPGGAEGEVVLYREDGGEALVRLFRGGRLAWFDSAALVSELDWDRKGRQA